MSDSRKGFITVTEAADHNLRSVDVEIPRDKLIVFTGVSGSGKSTLAFGTIYAEAQRRYLESVAPYARRLIQQVGAPHVGDITGLPMALALQQRRGVPSERTTVGTMTRIGNSLRMLYSRAGSYPQGTTSRLDSDAFSPNTVAGVCPVCQGSGVITEVTEDTLVHNPALSIRDGAVAAWPGAWQGQNYRDILKEMGVDLDRPWRELPAETRRWILFTDEQPTVTVHPGNRSTTYRGTFASARRYILHTLDSSNSERNRGRARSFTTEEPCVTCRGTGINPEALKVTFAGQSIDQMQQLPISDVDEILRPTAELRNPVAAVVSPDSGETTEVAVALARDLRKRIATVRDLGLDYLAINRSAPSLSSGELQRLRLAAQLRSGLFGVLYVLDEPSSGLHPSDTDRVIGALNELREQGNTVLIVEHNMRVAAGADWIVDIGPGAGEDGGRVLYSGPVEGLADVAASHTRPYLFRRDAVGIPRHRNLGTFLHLKDIHIRNFKGVDVDIPLHAFTVVSGVSGSGKTTLIDRVLAPDLREMFSGHTPAGLSGAESVTRMVEVDQKPIGRTPRSTIATYTGLFDQVRALFAGTPEAGSRGWNSSRFSFNVPGGRCETCQGQGTVSVELLFLPGTTAPCPTCHGARYNAETLKVRWEGMSIADVLARTVDSARDLFSGQPGIYKALEALSDVGLGYARLGQPATELSGGEAQRVKLAAELRRSARGHTLYLLDEPTTGLHPSDVDLLIEQFQALVDAGHTVVVIEHDLEVLRSADHVIDIGPGGGSHGGRVVATGTAEEIAASAESVTGRYLR
nr:excinuclease ABC subunit UvrA [Corynebacterium pacaense]